MNRAVSAAPSGARRAEGQRGPNPALLLLASRAVTVASLSYALGSSLPGGADGVPSPAPGRCEAGPTSVLVGYEPGAPLTEAGNDFRALRILRSAFPPPCFNLVLRSFRREDLAPTVVAGRLDVGVVGIASAATYAAHGATSLPARETEDVDTLMLHPASYSVVSIKAAPSQATPARRPWLLITGGALAGVALLTSCAYLLNFKLPRPSRWFEQARKQLDPRLTGLRGALGWVFGSASGRLLALARLRALAHDGTKRAVNGLGLPGDAEHRRHAERRYRERERGRR